MISLPASPLDTDPRTIFGGFVTDRIWTYVRGQYDIATTIAAGTGYWVFSRTETAITIPVSELQQEEIPLHENEWNLVAAIKRVPIVSTMSMSNVWEWHNGRFHPPTPKKLLTPLKGYFIYQANDDRFALLETENIPPIANAGPDQNVPLSTIVKLDGTSSSDANNDPLTFSWSFSAHPPNSSAVFSNPTAENPMFFVDLPGVYRILLTVSDGFVDSDPDVISIAIDKTKPLTIDLNKVEPNSGALTRIYGSTGDGRKGVPVAGGFDCDNDGLLDTAFAAIQASPLGRQRAGEVALVFGNGRIGGEIDSAGFCSDVLKIAGVQPFEVAGAEIWIDDVTGDGLGDLLICRQNHTPRSGRPGAGALSIVVGGPELRAQASALEYLDLSAPAPTTVLFTLYGAEAYDRLGIWVRAGDITGDGIADIVVGADEVDNPDEANRGAVYVIRGGAHLATSRVIDLAEFGTTVIAGHVARVHPPPDSKGFHFGSTCQIADLDQNGRGEVLMSAALNRSGAGIRLPNAPAGTGESSGGSDRGTLYIAWDDNFPAGDWEPGYEIQISAPVLGKRTIIDGGIVNRSFGEELLGGLDYDADGNPDLFVGDLVANGGNGVQSGVGYIFFNARVLRDRVFDMISPPEDIAFTFIKGPSARAIGADTAAHGDFNGDGIDDLAIGNPHDNPNGRTNAGSMHLLMGQNKTWPSEIDLSLDGLPDTEMIQIIRIDGANGQTGTDCGDTLCYSVAAADIDGDGNTDIIVNEMAGNGIAPNSIDVGNTLIISGAAVTGFSPD